MQVESTSKPLLTVDEVEQIRLFKKKKKPLHCALIKR